MHCRCNFPLTRLSDMFMPDAFFPRGAAPPDIFHQISVYFCTCQRKNTVYGTNIISGGGEECEKLKCPDISTLQEMNGFTQCLHSQLNQLITLKLCGLRLTVCWCVLVWCFLRSQLHDVPVAAVQRALCRGSVLGFELWSDRVDDEPRRQVEAFGQLRLTRPTSCTQTHKIKCKSNTDREKHWAESSTFVWCGFPNSTFLRINAKLHGSDIQIFTFNTEHLTPPQSVLEAEPIFDHLPSFIHCSLLFVVAVVVIQAFIMEGNRKSGNLRNAFSDQCPD